MKHLLKIDPETIEEKPLTAAQKQQIRESLLKKSSRTTLFQRKKVFASCLLALGVAAGVYVVADKTIVETTNVHSFGMMMTYENYQQHANASDLVVIGELVAEPKNVLTAYGEANQYVDGYHLSEVKVTKVLKGQETLTDRIIQVREPYYIQDKGIAPGVVEVFYGDYTKMIEGAQYVLFLGWRDDWNTYGISSAHEGKFNLDGKDEAEQQAAQQNEKIQQLKDEILNKPEITGAFE